ncbi:MAG TPA: hypothetical protein VHW96_03325 [Solirubrobacteraceae bacterium]|nr:hypothetical protein [Solirubrobacteraceae bacterium]
MIADAPSFAVAVLRHRAVAAALLVALVAETAQGIFVVLFIVFVARRLHGGAAEIGLLRGVQAVGAIAGGILLAAWRSSCARAPPPGCSPRRWA